MPEPQESSLEKQLHSAWESGAFEQLMQLINHPEINLNKTMSGRTFLLEVIKNTANFPQEHCEKIFDALLALKHPEQINLNQRDAGGYFPLMVL